MSESEARPHHDERWKIELDIGEWPAVLALTAAAARREGLFICSSCVASPGNEVDVVLILPDGNKVEFTGTVRSVIAEPGPHRPRGFSLRLGQKQSSDLVLLDAMASAFADGGPSAATRLDARVSVTIEAVEESAIRFDVASGPTQEAPIASATVGDSAPGGSAAGEFESAAEAPTADVSAAARRTRAGDRPVEPAGSAGEDADGQTDDDGEGRPRRKKVPSVVTLINSPDDEAAAEMVPEKTPVASTYDVEDQIQQALSGQVVDFQVPRVRPPDVPDPGRELEQEDEEQVDHRRDEVRTWTPGEEGKARREGGQPPRMPPVDVGGAAAGGDPTRSRQDTGEEEAYEEDEPTMSEWPPQVTPLDLEGDALQDGASTLPPGSVASSERPTVDGQKALSNRPTVEAAAPLSSKPTVEVPHGGAEDDVPLSARDEGGDDNLPLAVPPEQAGDDNLPLAVPEQPAQQDSEAPPPAGERGGEDRDVEVEVDVSGLFDEDESTADIDAALAAAKKRTTGPTSTVPAEDEPDAPPDEPPVVDPAPKPERSAEGGAGDAAAGADSGPSKTPTLVRRSVKQARAFGVDFGTTYCSIGLAYGKELVVFEDDEGYALVPTAVSYPERGAPKVGWAARECIATHPSTTFVSPKRLIGRDYDDPNIQPYLGATPVWTKRGPHGQVIAEVYGHPVSLVQVCAEVFRHVARLGGTAASRQVRQVVLAAPVAFEGEQRQAIARAAQMAGLEVIGIIDEPVAAALAYGAGDVPDSKVAVYDFGGGTFDFTLLDCQDNKFKVIGEAGDAWLGGDDFDLAIANVVAEDFWQKHKVDLRKRQVEWQRLIMLCEQAKRRLSREQSTVIVAKGIVLSLQGAIDLEFEIDRQLFADLCQELVDRAVEVMDTCFALSGVEPRDVDQVVLTGGISRIPMVKRQVEQFFGRELDQNINPEQAIVLGTTRVAYQTSGVWTPDD